MALISDLIDADCNASTVRDFASDFWLTRNGHGAGFWDGGWDHGDELAEIAHSFGECSVSFDPVFEMLEFYP